MEVRTLTVHLSAVGHPLMLCVWSREECVFSCVPHLNADGGLQTKIFKPISGCPLDSLSEMEDH